MYMILYIYIYDLTCVCISVCICVHVYVCMRIYMSVCVYVLTFPLSASQLHRCGPGTSLSSSPFLNCHAIFVNKPSHRDTGPYQGHN